MTSNSNQEQYKGSIWNPFVPTKRDITRTEELANKNPVLAGLLGFFFPIGACIYLNRLANNLKINIYFLILVAPIMFAFLSEPKKSYENSEKFFEDTDRIIQKYSPIMSGISFLGNIAMMAENARAVTLARKRQSEADS